MEKSSLTISNCQVFHKTSVLEYTWTLLFAKQLEYKWTHIPDTRSRYTTVHIHIQDKITSFKFMNFYAHMSTEYCDS